MNYEARLRFLLIAVASFMSWPSSFLHADGGTVRLSERKGAYFITVFTAPVPFRAGPVDISVLVQDGATKELMTKLRVLAKATPPGQANHASIYQNATMEAATNKLFYAATFELAEPGWYAVEVTIDGPKGQAQVHFELEAAKPLPRFSAIWPWIGWPVVAILLFGIHQVLVRKRLGNAAPPMRQMHGMA